MLRSALLLAVLLMPTATLADKIVNSDGAGFHRQSWGIAEYRSGMGCNPSKRFDQCSRSFRPRSHRRKLTKTRRRSRFRS
jgi:hypothetical protein